MPLTTTTTHSSSLTAVAAAGITSEKEEDDDDDQRRCTTTIETTTRTAGGGGATAITHDTTSTSIRTHDTSKVKACSTAAPLLSINVGRNWNTMRCCKSPSNIE